MVVEGDPACVAVLGIPLMTFITLLVQERLCSRWYNSKLIAFIPDHTLVNTCMALSLRNYKYIDWYLTHCRPAHDSHVWLMNKLYKLSMNTTHIIMCFCIPCTVLLIGLLRHLTVQTSLCSSPEAPHTHYSCLLSWITVLD